MGFVLFASYHFAVTLLLALTCYVLGRRLTYSLTYRSAAEELAFCTGLGLGCTAYLVFFLGVLGLMHLPVMLGTVALVQVACYRVWIDIAQRVREGVRWLIESKGARTRALLAFVGGAVGWALLLPIWAMPLYPPTAFDATVYHLAMAKWYLDHGRIVVAEYLRYPLFPHTNEMLHALMLPVSDIAAHLVQFLMMLLVGVALYGWGRRLFSVPVGIVAAGLWLGNPLVLWLGGSGLIDLGLALFVVLGIYALLNWLGERREWRWLLLAGAFTGFAAGSKYTALFFVALCGAALAIVAIRERRFVPMLVYGVTALVVASPWYIRSVLHTRNPVEPFLPSIFGYSRLWNETDMHNQLVDWRFKGIGTEPGNLLALPWDLATQQGEFGNDPPMLTVIYWLLPITAFWAARSRRIRGLLAVFVLFTLFWFFSGAQIQRYLLPVLPLLVLATVAAMWRTLRWVRRVGEWISKPQATWALAGLCLVPGWLYAVGRFEPRGLPPVTQEARDSYLARYLPPYPAHKWLNEQKGADYTVYGLRDDDMAYFTDGLHIGDWLGPGRNADVINALGSGDALYQSLARFKPDFFLVTNHRREYAMPADEEFRRRFRMVYSDNTSQIYEVLHGGE
jgi:4-amino-4-deoxy-L-arabinose transferase-like glycosyltransferase